MVINNVCLKYEECCFYVLVFIFYIFIFLIVLKSFLNFRCGIEGVKNRTIFWDFFENFFYGFILCY